jgi:putative alpha-1,2-mannosidase
VCPGGFPELQASFNHTSTFWQNVWDTKTQFFCPLNATGGQEECRSALFPELALFVFDNHYTEGDAWHWRWFAPHAMPELVQRLGGAQSYAALFDQFMTNSRKQVSNFLPNPWYASRVCATFFALFFRLLKTLLRLCVCAQVLVW